MTQQITSGSGRLESIAPDLWTVSVPLKLAGVDACTRATVVRLPNGRLWVHSPCRLSPELEAEVRALGDVAYLVAPNLFHHLYVAAWKRAFPQAKVFVAPGLDKKRKDLAVERVLGAAAEPEWADVLDQAFVDGCPSQNEVAFLHKPSGTLILTDLLFHAHHADALLDRFFFRLNGVLGGAGRSLMGRLFMREPAKAKAGVDKIRSWRFDRILLAHRDAVETGGQQVFARAFANV